MPDEVAGGLAARRVFDCTTFTGDIDGLVDRLRSLSDAVDVFVIAEPASPREGGCEISSLRESWTRLKPFAAQLRHVVVPGNQLTGQPRIDAQTLANALLQGLRDLGPADLVLLSRTGSVPTPASVRAARSDRIACLFQLEGPAGTLAITQLELARRAPAQIIEGMPQFDRSSSAAATTDSAQLSVSEAEDSRPVIICPYVNPEDVDRVRKAFGLDEPAGKDLPFFFWHDTELIGPERAYEQCWSQFPDRDVIIVHTDMYPAADDVTNAWYDELLRWADRLPDAGAIACDLLFPHLTSNGQPAAQCVGGTLDAGKVGHLGGREFPYDERFTRARLTDWVTFGGVLLRRSALDMVGSFDSAYQWAYVMDVDYSLEMRLRGLNVYQVPVNLVHEENGSTAAMLALPEYKAKVDGNIDWFERKWAELLREPSTLPSQAHKYRNQFADWNSFGRCVELIGLYGESTGAHIDIGCGLGVIAESLRDHGLSYIGFDVDESALLDLAARGFETQAIDLSDVGGSERLIRAALGERRLTSISMLDCLEHLTNGGDILQMLHSVAEEYGAILIISVPNVAHFDLGAKLISGQWDYTETGLLDRTHFVFFTETHLREVASKNGWHEIGAADVVLFHGDQAFPVGSAAISEATPIGQYLRNHREVSDHRGTSYQLVRAFRPGVPVVVHPLHQRRPDLSVVLAVPHRDQSFDQERFSEMLRDLTNQVDPQFELIVVHTFDDAADVSAVYEMTNAMAGSIYRGQVICAPGATWAATRNLAIEHATGDHIAFFEADYRVLPTWTQEFAGFPSEHKANILRTGVAPAKPEHPDEPTGPAPQPFSVVAHIRANQSPLPTLAFPRTLFFDLGVRFGDEPDRDEAWILTMRGALMCGVATGGANTVTHLSAKADDDRKTLSRKLARNQLLAELDGRGYAFALPPGVLGEIHALEARAALAERELRSLQQRPEFKVARPFRAARRRFRNRQTSKLPKPPG